MSDPIRDAGAFLRAAEERLARIQGTTVEKAEDGVQDVEMPGALPVSTIALPEGVHDLEPDYPGVRKVGVQRRVFHMVPPAVTGEEWHLADGQDNVLISSASDEGLIDALGDIVTLTKPGQESKSALEGRSRPLTVDEAVEYLMFSAAMDGVPEIKAAGLGYVDTDPDPSPKKGARTLRRYWTRGKGAAKILWGTPGDFKRCVRHLRKYVGTGAEGLCNIYHQTAVGAPPGKGH